MESLRQNWGVLRQMRASGSIGDDRSELIKQRILLD
jgi:hypothetical protein